MDTPDPHPPTSPTFEPNVGPPTSRRPDRGTPLTLGLAWVLTIVGFLTVAFLQGAKSEAPPEATPAPADAVAAETIPAPPSADVAMASKLMVNLFNASREGEAGEAEFQRARETGQLNMIIRLMTGDESDPEAQSIAKTWNDRIRLSAVVADLAGRERALEDLDAIEERVLHPTLDDAPPAAGFDQDLHDFRAIYNGETLPDEARERLVKRHGWFAELALVADLPPSDPAKDELVEHRWLVTIGAVVLGLVFLTGILAGCTLLITACVLKLVGRMRPRFEPPSPGGSVYLETFAAFVFGFLGVMGVALTLGLLREGGAFELSDMGLESAVMATQWGLGLAVFWPVVRGVPWSEARRALGWHAPRGVLREVVAGFLGYLCGIPLMMLGALVTLVLVAITTWLKGAEPEPIRTDAADLVTQASTGTLILLGSLVVIWAPLVEETIFRGALYRHFRGRLHFIFAAPITALLFAFMHSYGILFTPPLIMLAMVFASLREWRGSIIPCVVAHCLQNSVAFTMMIVLFRMA